MVIRRGLPLLCIIALCSEPLWVESAPSPRQRRAFSVGLLPTNEAKFKYDPSVRLKETAEAIEADTLPDGTIRLPKQKVFAKRDPAFAEHDLYDPAGRMELARHRYLSDFHRNVLNRLKISNYDSVYAMARYKEDREAAAKQNALAKVQMYEALGDKEMTAEFKRLARQTQRTQVYNADVMSRTHLPR